MWNEFHEFYDVELLKMLMISEIEDNNDRYRRHYNGTLFELLKGVYDYVKDGKYSQDCVDLCVDAACHILNINIGIFQNVGGLAQCINYKAERPTNRDIFLLYNNDHYESIMFSGKVNVKADKFKLPVIEDIGSDDEEEIVDGSKWMNYLKSLQYKNSNSENDEGEANESGEAYKKWVPNRNFHQSDSDIDDPHFAPLPTSSMKEASTDCIDLTSDYYSETQTTDSSTSTSMPEFPEYREKPPKYSKWPINSHTMLKVVAKVVDYVPWDVDGNCKYIVKCCSETWMNKTGDGRWFHMRTSGRKIPNVVKKVGHCQGSYICKYEKCSKRTYENTINRIDFRRTSDGDVVCGPCGSYATKIYCGATKRIKFDKIKGEAIVEHEGVHNCNVKPNKRKKQRIIDKQPMPISGFNTPHKTKKAMMRLKMDKKEYKDVLEIAETVSTDDLKARISCLRRDSSRPLSARDECEVYGHIRRLKKEFHEEFGDPNLVYKECCAHETVSEEGSYVFKTCKTSLEMAAKMAGAKQAKGEDSQL